jgi:hypothetical protein
MTKAASRTGRAAFKAIIAGTREEVYRELTRTDRPLRAWPNARLHTPGLEAEARLQLRTATGEYTLADGVVLVHDPPRRFSHTLCYTRLRDPAFVVDYDLRESRTDVELTLTLEDLPLGTRTSRQALRDAARVMSDLKHVVEDGRLALAGRVRHIWASLMEFSLPAETLAERWPLDATRRARTTTTIR